METTEAFLKEEEERFYKLQLNDEFTLQDRIETLTAQVVQLSQLRDFEKVLHLSMSITKIWLEIEEEFQNANKRKRL